MVAAFTVPDVPQTTSSEEAWIAAAKNGDERAFGKLVKQHERRVFRLAGRFFRRREDVEDLAQETFLTAWSKLGTYRGDAPFEHWLTRLCLNLCYARLRKKSPAEEPFEGSLGEKEEAAESDPTARLEVRRLLARLAPEDRFILLLLDGQGWSVAEIAEQLGWTKVNVKVRAHRARKRLRSLVEREIEP